MFVIADIFSANKSMAAAKPLNHAASLTRHINGFFSHSTNALWSSQLQLSSQSCMSKRKKMHARMSRISCMARLLPRQLRGPYANGCTASSRSASYAGSPSQRSGAKVSGLAKLDRLLLVA
jgi:hypothetical protein